ncbi:MAG TPA: nucleotidyltransferase domain-containing protein [Polyangia bacterium]
MTTGRRDARAQARFIYETRYSDAAALLLAGSVVRGEATAHSDLDLVVLYERVAHARRESFVSDGWPVEAFVHDAETLRYFFVEVDARAGTPSLAAMVLEGIDVVAGDRPSAATVAAKRQAAEHVAAGPAAWSERELQQRRYVLTDLVDDLRAPRSDAERVAAGARLYELLADCILRSARRWSARGKSIPRVLAQHDAALAARFVAAFDALFAAGDTAAIVALVEEVLRPLGGLLFDGYRLDAPADWRSR